MTPPADPKSSARNQGPVSGAAASRLIDQRIRELDDWRGATLARMRALILAADPDMVEEVKWRGTPVWSHEGIVCTGETYKRVVKLTFAKGASLPDPTGLFNASLEGNTRRAIDIHEGEQINAVAFKKLIKAAVALNANKLSAKPKTTKKATKEATKDVKKEVVLLSGGNPQIPKGEGDAPVQAYIAAMPGWKREVGERFDALIEKTVPNVRKAVKWNSPFYGIAGQGWFLSVHVYARYVQVAFFQGAALKPPPPKGSKDPNVRYLDIHEGEFDAAQLRTWIKQAAALPGWKASKSD